MTTLANAVPRAARPFDYWIDGGPSWMPGHAWPDDPTLNYDALGLCRFRVLTDRVSLTWSADKVEPAALESARGFIERLGPRRCDLHYLRLGWIEESYPCPSMAAERIAEIRGGQNVVLLPAGVSIRRMPLEHLANAHSHLSDTLRALQSAAPEDWASSELGRAGILYRRDGACLRYEHVGTLTEVYRMLGRRWWRDARGRRCEDAFSDPEFNRRLNIAYDLATEEGGPVLEEAVANVEQSGKRMIVPFTRLTIPLDREHLAVVVRRRNGPDTLLASGTPALLARPAYLEVA